MTFAWKGSIVWFRRSQQGLGVMVTVTHVVSAKREVDIAL